MSKCNKCMWRAIRFFFRDPVIKYPAVAAAVFIAAQVIFLARAVRFKGEPIFLHYTTYFGVDFVGARGLAYLFPLVGFVVLLLNLALAYLIAKPSGGEALKHSRLMGYFLTCGAAVCAALLLVQVLLIVRLNS